jgi:hypothetical protein
VAHGQRERASQRKATTNHEFGADDGEVTITGKQKERENDKTRK